MSRSVVAAFAVIFVLAAVGLVMFESQELTSEAAGVTVTVHVDAQGIVSFEGVPIGEAMNTATLSKPHPPLEGCKPCERPISVQAP